jgi:hypothetical protein
MFYIQTVLHYSLHFLAPGIIAWLFFKSRWQTVWLILIATMVIDSDHLLATPIFDPHRCGIGFHPLHSIYAILVYVVLLFFPNFYIRIIAIGLLFHMLTDFQDCLWIFL